MSDTLADIKTEIARRQSPPSDTLGAIKQEIASRGASVGVVGGASAAAVDGLTFGFGDEYLAGLSAVLGLQPDGQGGASFFQYDKPTNERYSIALDAIRREQSSFRDSHPKTAMVSEVAGALATPGIGLAKGGVAGAKSAAAIGAGGAAVYEFGEGENGAAERMRGVPVAAATGALFGASANAAFKGGSRAFQRLFRESQKRPTIELLKATKSAAYSAVDSSGFKFQPDDIKGMLVRVETLLDDDFFVRSASPKTDAALQMLEKAAQQNSGVTLKGLDKFRQTLWRMYSKADDEVGLLDIISEVDGLIASKGDASDIMAAARLANARYRKAQMLEDAFHKAELDTSRSGSGGNILNNYRAAVTRILKSDKSRKWFSDEEVAAMERFVQGEASENIMRRIGKMAPSGNGLMMALNLGAASIDPTMLTVSAVASGAKEIADASAKKGTQELRDLAATGSVMTPRLGKMPAPTVPANLAGQVNRD